MAKLSKYKLRVWSIRIRWRDRKCVICGSREKLQAHHLADKSYHPELAYDLDNGVTLCNSNKKDGHSCHKAFHIYFKGSYRKKCSIEDFCQFAKIAGNYFNG